MQSTLVKKPVFWIVILLASAACMFAVLHWFGDAFSVLDLDVTMSRTTAIDAARRIATDQKLSDAPLPEAVAQFDGDSDTQTFIELEGGGKPALKPFLENGEFNLYHWDVRLYAPREEREVRVGFTPAGRPSGFFSRIPESAAGAALDEAAARAVAVAAATRDWGIDFGRYRPLTASSQTQPGKRVDHDFVYERTADGAPVIGAGRLRLAMTVSGDRLTALRRYVFVPEAFTRRYATLRATNNNIAGAAGVFAGLVYGLGGCLVGLVWLMRRHAVRWAPSAKWAAVVAVLTAGAGLAAIPGSWFAYNTATSASTHLYTRVGSALVGGVVTWLLLTVVFATAEGLGRLAFGSHPQLWKAWRQPAAHSGAIWGRTLAGYAWIGFDLAFIALFYFLVDRYLGWWSPSDALVDPNILGAPTPWIAPVSMALQAGMMEESLFRAIPLAGAALLGRRYRKEKLFIGVALVLQAIVFGCAHANYPGQPAYARPVELFLPALVWGVVYLRYGLLPGILFHFGFDLVLMSIPLFVTAAPGIGVDRAIVVTILMLPLLVLIVQRVRAGRLIDLPAGERNAAAAVAVVNPASPEWHDAEDAVVHAVDDIAAGTGPLLAPERGARLGARRLVILALFAIVGVIGLGLKIRAPFDAPGLSIGRDEALVIAERALVDRGVTLDARWQRSAKAVGIVDASGANFVWREGGAALFAQLMDHALAPPHWIVRFARFDGDVADRDSWEVSVVDGRAAPDGVRVVEHDVPEARPGKRLDEGQARAIADQAIAGWLKLPVKDLRPVSARAVERPARVDWLFVYADPAVALPAGGESRVVVEVDGDEVASVGRNLFVPEAWSRDETRRNEKLIYPRGLLALIGFAFGVATLISLVRRLSRGEASLRGAWVVAGIAVVTLTAGTLLDFDVTRFGFTVTEPLDSQLLRTALSWAGTTIAAALLGGLVAAVGVRIARPAELARPRAWLQRWAVPMALGLLAAGIGGFGALGGASREPRIPAVGAADSYAPWLGSLLGGLGLVGVAAGLLLTVAVLSSPRRKIAVLVFLAFVASAALGRASTPGVAVSSIALAAAGGAAGWWIFREYLRDRPWDLAPLMLCLALFGQVGALARPSYPGARIAAVCGLVGSMVGYRIWRWLVERDARRVVP